MSDLTFNLIIWTVALFLVFAAYLQVKEIIKDSKAPSEDEQIIRIPEFSVTEKLRGCNEAGIALDGKRQKICIYKNSNRKLIYTVLKPKDLHSIKIVEDGTMITETAQKARIGRAIIGGVAFGGAGAIIGGLSGKSLSTSKNYITQLDLQIVLKNFKDPIHTICLMPSGRKIDKSSEVYKKGIEKARKWVAIIEVFINSENLTDKPDQYSVADELNKLLRLKNQGALTQSEYENQKTKILS